MIKKNYLLKDLKIFLYGITVGIFNLIPGISGGSIIALLGIYKKTIKGHSNLTWKNIKKVFKLLFTFHLKKLHLFLRKIRFNYIFLLGIGGVVGLFSFGRIVDFALKNYKVQTIIFFIVLITCGFSYHFYKEVLTDKTKNKFLYFFMGILISSTFLFLPENLLRINLNYFTLFILGIFLYLLMLIPGVSGSLFLLVIGAYEKFIGYIKTPFQSIIPITFFGIGCIIAYIIFVKYLSKLYLKYDKQLHQFFCGLILISIILVIKINFL